jgi:hypothetical protein
MPRLAKYCLKCRAERRRRAKAKYTWRPEYDAYLKAYYFGELNRRFQVLTRMVRLPKQINLDLIELLQPFRPSQSFPGT